MKLFFLAKKGLHLNDPDVITKKSDKISLNTKQPIEIDGDFFDYGPAEIFVKKHSIQLKIQYYLKNTLRRNMAKKEDEVIEEPTLEDL